MRISRPIRHHSLGNRLFLWVLGAALAALGGTAVFSYRTLEHNAHDQIQGNLRTQATQIESQLGKVEAYSIGLATAVKVNQAASVTRGTTDAQTTDAQTIDAQTTYEQLAFEYFKQRPDLIMAIGFGQAPHALQPDRQWLYHYFYLDQGVEGAKGRFLPAPDNQIRYSELFADDNYPAQDYYKLPTQSGKNLWVQPYDWYGITMTSFMVPIVDRQGKVLGVVGSDVNVSAISKLIAMPVMNQQGYYAILSEQGNLLGYPPEPSKAKEATNYTQVPGLEPIWQLAQTQAAGLRQIDGKIWAFRRIRGTQWLIVAMVPQSAVIQPILISTSLGAIGAGTFLAIAVAVFVRQLNRRLQTIVTVCDQLQSQYASPPLPPTELTSGATPIAPSDRNADELTILATTVTQMSQQLQLAFDRLAQNNEVLEQRVAARTNELSQTLHHLQTTQVQMVQSEKMSALGNLVAGVAHEINNPISFIGGNIHPARIYIANLFKLIDLYQSEYPEPNAVITDNIATIDLNYLRQDLPLLLGSMSVGVERIEAISKSLRTFSRADAEQVTRFDVHEGLESTLMILKHRLKANERRPEIAVVKHYGDFPEIECFAGQLNQVFMNLIANAIDALEECNQDKCFSDIDDRCNCITITTAMQHQQVTITIGDNGPGMPASVQSRIFEHLFTTKPVGQGTGLGLSIAYQIITEQHQGQIDVQSAIGAGTTFTMTLPVTLPGRSSAIAASVSESAGDGFSRDGFSRDELAA
jgi:signal transduction histidine kinase